MCFEVFSLFLLLVFSLSTTHYSHAWVAVVRPTQISWIGGRRTTRNNNNNNNNNNAISIVQASTNCRLQQSISSNDDDATSQFGTKEYWDDLYAGRGEFPAEEYSWYFGWGKYEKLVREFIPDKDAKILLPGIGNDPILLDLLQNGYKDLTASDYSDHAIERQQDLISYYSDADDSVELRCMDARQMDESWTDKFDAVLEKGALDAIYLSGDGNLELAVKELERCIKPGGVIVSVSGVVPEELRRDVFENWEWLRDGSDDLQAGCFVLSKPK
jgi:SAM-dependent methyltransferase